MGLQMHLGPGKGAAELTTSPHPFLGDAYPAESDQRGRQRGGGCCPQRGPEPHPE